MKNNLPCKNKAIYEEAWILIKINLYSSEKFWRNALGEGLVPIVYGPHEDDVKAVAPPNSYIHAEW